jgi:hypothetical protein
MMHSDPFTTELDLEPFWPFAYSHDAAGPFRDGFGTHWLVLDSIYASGQGATVHVVRPVTPEVGGGMDSFAEDLGKVIRERDVRAVAIFTYFPDAPNDLIRRPVFTRAKEPVTAATTRIQLSRREPRYSRHPDFYPYSFDDGSNMLGTPVPKETPIEVVARANRLSDWAKLESEARRANRDAIPSTCRLRLHDWEDRETRRPTRTIRSVGELVSNNEQYRAVKYLVRRHFGALRLVGQPCRKVRIQHPRKSFRLSDKDIRLAEIVSACPVASE